MSATNQASHETPPLLVAECKPDRILAKRFRADGTKIDFSAGWQFKFHELHVASWVDLVEVLEMLTDQPCMCVLRGGLDPEFPRDDAPWYHRRKHDRPDDPAALQPAAFPWVVYDFDDTDAPFDTAAPTKSVRAWHSTLPPELRAARGAFFLSATAHTSPTVRGKLVTWYRGPIGESQARALACYYGADPSVGHCYQPNFFAAPIFEPGARDPIAALRHQPVMFDGPPAHMPNRAAMKAFKHRAPPKGVPLKELPPGDQGILASLGGAAEQVGRRFWICGQLGGIMRKLGFKKEACAAVLREWLAELPAPSIEHGVAWAVQAWEKRTDEVSGIVALRETVGKAHADVIEQACLKARRPVKVVIK